MMAVDPEVLEGEPEDEPSSALARPLHIDNDRLRSDLEKLKLSMQASLEADRKATKEDRLETHRVRITAMMAAAIISEGAVGQRPTKQMVARMACEYADEVLSELRKRGVR